MEKKKTIHVDAFRIFLVMLCFVTVSVLGASYVCNAADPPPSGSYKKTCKEIQYRASTDEILVATCKRMNGSWNGTSLSNAQQCRNTGGDVENCNGKLYCTGRNLPNVGSYRNSCWCCQMQGTGLNCYCKPKKGVSRYTNLPDATSYSNIWNDNGRLRGSGRYK